MRAIDKFDGIAADFWDCDDCPESLCNTDPVDALERHIDGWLSPGCDTVAIIRGFGKVEITPWFRNKLNQGHIDDAVDRMLQLAEELLDEDEELGDPNGDHNCLADKALKEHRPKFVEAVKALYAEAEPWGCEDGKPVVLTADEVIELMREHCPEWFETEVAP